MDKFYVDDEYRLVEKTDNFWLKDMISMRKFLLIIGTLSLALLLVACGNSDEEVENNNAQEEDPVEFSDEELVDEDEIVLTINETEITGEQYNSLYVQHKIRLHQYRQDISDLEALKEQTLEMLIDQELLKQDAEKAGITVTPEELDEEFTSIKDEVTTEQFIVFLEDNQMTEEDFKEQLHFSLLYDKYVAETIPEIEVSDAEVEEVYQELKGEDEDFPELEEVAEFLKVELAMQKEYEYVEDKLAQLREEAEIETNL